MRATQMQPKRRLRAKRRPEHIEELAMACIMLIVKRLESTMPVLESINGRASTNTDRCSLCVSLHFSFSFMWVTSVSLLWVRLKFSIRLPRV